MDLDNTVVKGRHVLAEALKAAGVEYVFGIVVCLMYQSRIWVNH